MKLKTTVGAGKGATKQGLVPPFLVQGTCSKDPYLVLEWRGEILLVDLGDKMGSPGGVSFVRKLQDLENSEMYELNYHGRVILENE